MVSVESGKHVHPLRMDSSCVDLLRNGLGIWPQANGNGASIYSCVIF